MRRRSVVLFALFAVSLIAASAHARKAAIPNPEPVPGGQLNVIAVGGTPPAEPVSFPLKHTAVRAELSGYVAQVEVKQTYLNPFPVAIEAVYTFPLPDDAAVNAMQMRIGDRTIQGEIKTREAARETYEAAKAQGKTTALLDQQRPNIFTQQVANILPGQKIEITLRYVAILKYDAGEYEFNFPTVVGPRYIPGDKLPTPPTGHGWSGNTTEVSDASKITPPILRPGERSGHDIDIQVSMDAGMPISGLRSPSHELTVVRSGTSTAQVALRPADRIPNKDFILRYSLAGKRPESAVLATRPAGSTNGYVTLMIQPQAKFTDEVVTPKEMVFVVDTSGSMRGAPMDKAKELMRRAIDDMHPGDSFQILDFDDSVSQLSPRPLTNTASNRALAIAHVNAFRGSGGTRMLSGIEAALAPEPDDNRMRIIVFITDGFIGNEAQILERIQKNLGEARIFVFGVGSSVNHFLLDRMAKEGRGFKQYIRPDENTNQVVTKFYGRIARPLLTDVQIDWGGLAVRDQIPARIPDLFSAQPVFVHARYRRPGATTVRVTGKIAGKPFEQKLAVTLPAREPANAAIGSVWARTQIAELERAQYGGEKPKIKKQITKLALEHQLMSRYTSFVAVEQTVVRDPRTGKVRTVVQPVELPEGVDYEGVGGATTRGVKRKGKQSSGRYSMSPRRAPGKSVSRGSGVGYGRAGHGAVAGDMAAPEPAPVASASEETAATYKPAPANKVRLLGPVGATALDKKSLRRVVRQLDKMAAGRGALSGALVVELAVGADGRVTKVTITRDAIGEPAIVTVVKRAFGRARLEATGSKRTVRFKVQF